jgi:UDP-N-acetylmuramyl tripeptide synthase
MIEKIYQQFQKAYKVSTDSRKVEQDAVFFALKGENFDANDFALQVAEQGVASLVVADRKDLPKHERILIVDDSLKALQDLAAYHRQQSKAIVLSITGTNGKTTTKELVSAVLSKKYNITHTIGNLNNHIGVPLTLLSIKPDTEMAVVEMGANPPGEIDFLCKIADPDYGLITNIGKAHLEGFGSFEGVIKTKTELYRHIKANGKATLIIRTGSKSGTIKGRLTLESTNGEWTDVTCDLTQSITGVQNLFFTFAGSGQSLFDFDNWQFFEAPTAIHELHHHKTTNKNAYNLRGNRIDSESSHHGIKIVNGKKISL